MSASPAQARISTTVKRRTPSATEPENISDEVYYSWSSNKGVLEELYSYIKKLGRGSFGLVCLLKEKHTSNLFACKIIKKTGANGSYDAMQREVEIMKSIKPEHIVTLKEVFETPQKFYLIME